MKKAKAPRWAGFSFIELMLVLGLLGFLTALTAPMISRGTDGVRLKTATKQTASIFRYARNESVARKKPYWVVVDREEKWVSVITRPLNVGAGEDRYDRKTVVATKGSKFFEYPEPVATRSVTVGNEEIETQGAFIFFPNGSSSGGTIILHIDETRSFVVSLDFITSMVSIKRGSEAA